MNLHPHPKDMVVIRGNNGSGLGDWYVVPPGRIFVLLALGTRLFAGVDGVSVITTLYANLEPVMRAGWFGRGPFGTGILTQGIIADIDVVARVPDCICFAAGTQLITRTNAIAFGQFDNYSRAFGFTTGL